MKLIRREIWKSISDFPGYEVSSWGRIRSFWKIIGRGITIKADMPQRVMKTNIATNGYPQIILRKDGKKYTKTAHRFVLETFVSSCPEGMEARHKDGVRSNPDLTNLCWGTKSENQLDSVIHGTHIDISGEKNPSVKLTDIQVKEIKNKLKLGFTLAELGREYRVTYQTILAIAHGKTWKVTAENAAAESFEKSQAESDIKSSNKNDSEQG